MLLVSAAAWAGHGGELELVYGPWIQNVTEDSVTILWTTNEKSLCWVEMSEDKGNTFYHEGGRAKYFQTISGRKYYGTFHSVTIKGLRKATQYQYRIVGKPIADDSNPYGIAYGAEQDITGAKKIKTLDYNAPKCCFSMVNDMHFDDAKYARLMSGMDKSKSDFIVLCGDIISFSNCQDTLIKHTFQPIKDLAAQFPIIFARGNHEGRGAEWYLAKDAFPSNTGEFYYTFRQGPVAFIVLDAGEDKPDSDPEYSDQAAYDEYRQQELEWLKKAVKAPEFANAPHKVCLIHIPVLDGPTSWYSQHWIAENFTPVLNDAGVKLMLSGHHHKYILAKPGEYGNNFTILANSANERLDFEADKSTITVKIFDRDGKMNHSMTL